ncbi:YpmS family protein [Bacillus massilinigeriensis]|uniref:YpmS family protein n=1 Tax=Bacillus massilionigeriensis TaxID=1805475 RepID=UPI0028FCC2D8|nr:YpmS family protein [Bacillus massilionigeriensis]
MLIKKSHPEVRHINEMRNHWKGLFFLLLGINIAITLFLIIMVLVPSDSKQQVKVNTKKQSLVSFPVETNKDDLNKVINYYIKKEAKGAIDYEVYLRDEVELYGTLGFFGEDVQLRLTFEPQALSNGDLLLKQKSISIGKLHLPVSYVLKFVAQQYKLPDWVIIEPQEEQVYVSLQNMKLKSDLRVQVNKFDLLHDEINLTFGIPIK